ncbi:MAG: aminotransferase class I/II-fold pyridoxal phosphate-dependent enzyme, partial [Candidatus Sericytochromatia bacterium]
MRKASDFLDAMDEVLSRARDAGVLFRTLEDAQIDGRTITLGGRPLVNFGSCSYLGLEMDERLKQGAIEAVQRYGTQFSSSRGYMALPLYEELESLFADIFGMPTLVAPTTTLAHASALPILIGEDDAVLMDQQVHHSVQQGVNHVRVQGVPVEIVRHNRMDLLEARVAEISKKHRKIWYLADGVYSMYGDLVPMKALHELMQRHEKLHLYIDDAHGMSWHGDRGQGYALDQIPHHPRLIVVTSLAKAFG